MISQIRKPHGLAEKEQKVSHPKNRTPRKLFKAYSYVDNHESLGRVCFEWVYHMREKPVASYEDLLAGYHSLDSEAKSRAEDEVDALFTAEEVEALAVYLENVHGYDSFLAEKYLPIEPKRIRDKGILEMDTGTTGGIYLMSEDKGYNLPFAVRGYYYLRGDEIDYERDISVMIHEASEKVTWLAKQIFTAFPKIVTGLQFYVLNCACIYYQRRLFDGTLVSKAGIYRDPEYGACDLCMAMDETWRDRVVFQTVVYNLGFKTE